MVTVNSRQKLASIPSPHASPEQTLAGYLRITRNCAA
jgi:hypothetical protein